jgi:hypothetical protein
MTTPESASIMTDVYPDVMSDELKSDLGHLTAIAQALHPNSKDDAFVRACEFVDDERIVVRADKLLDRYEIIGLTAQQYVANRAESREQSPEATADDLDTLFARKLKSDGHCPERKSRVAIVESLAGSDEPYMNDVFNILADKYEERAWRIKRAVVGVGAAATVAAALLGRSIAQRR